MSKRNQTRKQHFKAALAYAGVTQKQWAEENDVTTTHLYLVLAGQRESEKLLAAIDAFIAKHSQVAA